jgi:hypothetical protein
MGTDIVESAFCEFNVDDGRQVTAVLNVLAIWTKLVGRSVIAVKPAGSRRDHNIVKKQRSRK